MLKLNIRTPDNLITFRSAQRGVIPLTAKASFETTLTRALGRITGLITSKLDQFFELSEYEWTPATREDAPSMYLYELVNWLTTVVDSLVIKEAYKDEAYRGALEYIAGCLMVCIITHLMLPLIKQKSELPDWQGYSIDE